MTARDWGQQTQARGKSRSHKRRGIVVLLLFFIVAFLAVTSLANRWKGELLVDRVDVWGNHILTEKDLIALAKVPIGTPLYDVDLLEIRSRIRSNPYVMDAVVAHDLPSTIKITVRERKPAAILGGSDPYYVSVDGYVLPAVNSKEVFDLPVITGASRSQTIKAGMKLGSENFEAAMEILADAATLNPDLYHLISEINISSIDPIVYTAEQGIPIFFRTEDIHTQLVYLMSFWSQYVRQQASERVRSIDLRFSDQVVAVCNKPSSAEKPL
jgi:cell division septal protein FtsQ